MQISCCKKKRHDNNKIVIVPLLFYKNRILLNLDPLSVFCISREIFVQNTLLLSLVTCV